MPEDATHQRLKRVRGKATARLCIDCGKSAYEWAYQHTGDPEDLNSYAPMCRSCHRKWDLKMSPVLQESWAQNRGTLTAESRARGLQNRTRQGRPIEHDEAVSMGRAGGFARSFSMQFNPELRERMVSVAIGNLPRGHRRCAECGQVSTAPGIGNHQKSSGHTGWEPA